MKLAILLLLSITTAVSAAPRVDVEGNKLQIAWENLPETKIETSTASVQVDGKQLLLTKPQIGDETFDDPILGPGKETNEIWPGDVYFIRSIRTYDRHPFISIESRVWNKTTHDISLGNVAVLAGSWTLDDSHRSPAVDYVSGSTLLCGPAGTRAARNYSGSVIDLAGKAGRSLVVGFVTAPVARPEVAMHYEDRPGGSTFHVDQPLNGRRLQPGKTLQLGTIYIAAQNDPYKNIEDYAKAVGEFSPIKPRPRITSLWCSWYAHRMAMTEDLVLANAAVAAKYFKPLGMEFIQLDHGWERGDITGDWFANDRFPHGLKWLSDQLQSRYGLKLGLWIAPSDVAEPSKTFQDHPDWMLKGPDGKPLVNWKWYWKPNPNDYELDATNPAANQWIRDTFARLTSQGAAYYKIDFIASSGGEQFIQSDPYSTRGWSNLVAAMQAIRAGAGPAAHIRYCQTPPLLSVGLADSTIGGADTGDAGNPQLFPVLKENAQSLAAGYWLNDTLYHREVCDMSVRMLADIEETRLRLAMMDLAGCSISFSDEFQHLPASRLALMQKSLPPGAPPMRPIDLFDRSIPSIWKLHCKTAADEWDIYGLFNFEDKPESRAFDLPDSDQLLFEFWESKFLGLHRKHFELTLPPRTSRIVSVRAASNHPQVIGTDMHMLQGFHELTQLKWDAGAHALTVQCTRAPGIDGQVFIYVPEGFSPHFDFPLTEKSAHLTHIAGSLWSHEVHFDTSTQSWSIPFDGAAVKKTSATTEPIQ